MFEFAWPWLFAALPLPLLAWLLPAKKQNQGVALKVPHITPGLTSDHQNSGGSRVNLLFFAPNGWASRLIFLPKAEI